MADQIEHYQWYKYSRKCLHCALIIIAAMTLIQCTKRSPNSRPIEVWKTTEIGTFSVSSKKSAPIISQEVLLIADNQFHENYGTPVVFQSQFADLISDVASRPAQMRLFGPDVMKFVLNRNRSGPKLPVIHIGDALNASCKSEADLFFKTMNETSDVWVMAPGNHDGYYFGMIHPIKNSYDPAQKQDFEDWEHVCTPNGTTLSDDKNPWKYTRNRFLRRYLNELEANFASSGKFSRSTGSWLKGTGSFLRRLHWNIDQKEPWNSFLLQEINLNLSKKGSPEVYLILLDTGQTNSQPSLGIISINNMGENGGIIINQRDVAKRWIEFNANQKAITILGGHHDYPFGMDPHAIGKFKDVAHAGKPPFYLSAHTHAGLDRRLFENTSTEMIELNVGSLIDWPIEYRPFVLLAAEQKDDNPKV